MNTHAYKTRRNRSLSVVNDEISQKQSGGVPGFQFIDNHPEAFTQRKLQRTAHDKPQEKQIAQLLSMADSHSARNQPPIQKKENNTGLPGNLKLGIESLSGSSMGEVKAHYNSTRPAQLHAQTYAQGADIHIASGQERQLRSRTNNSEAVQLINSDAVQLVRIKLRDQDKDLMGELRQVPVNQGGDQTVEAPTRLGDLNGLSEIGPSENIVLEGHGNTNDEGIAHGQGGWSPLALAQFANKVPKPEHWSGSIILLGCRTGGITEEVSKAYYRLTKKPVTVTGTLENIKVGKSREGINFIGTDWSKYPEEERPEDLKIIKKVEKGIEDFHDLCVTRLIEIARAMGETTDDVSVVIPYDFGTLELDAWKLLPFEGHDPKYLWFERWKIHRDFDKLLNIVKDDADVIVGRILRVKDKTRGMTAIRGDLIEGLRQFNAEYEQAYLPLLQQVRGLGLKPVDLSNVGHVKRSRMEETSKFGGLLGERWTDRLGP